MDIILYNIIIGFCCFFLGYLFGSIPFGIIIGKVFFNKDPRNEGSKNSGGTNVGRVCGKAAGIVVIILDMLKTVIPMMIVWCIFKFSPLFDTFYKNLGSNIWDNGILYIYLAPLGATVGHCWPLFANFRGGKCVASLAGFGISTSWMLSLFGFGTFFIMFKTKHYVSLSSIVASIISTIIVWIFFMIKTIVNVSFQNFPMWGWGEFVVCGWEYALVITLITILLLIRHIPNIKRLISHQEKKVMLNI